MQQQDLLDQLQASASSPNSTSCPDSLIPHLLAQNLAVSVPSATGLLLVAAQHARPFLTHSEPAPAQPQTLQPSEQAQAPQTRHPSSSHFAGTPHQASAEASTAQLSRPEKAGVSPVRSPRRDPRLVGSPLHPPGGTVSSPGAAVPLHGPESSAGASPVASQSEAAQPKSPATGRKGRKRGRAAEASVDVGGQGVAVQSSKPESPAGAAQPQSAAGVADDGDPTTAASGPHRTRVRQADGRSRPDSDAAASTSQPASASLTAAADGAPTASRKPDQGDTATLPASAAAAVAQDQAPEGLGHRPASEGTGHQGAAGQPLRPWLGPEGQLAQGLWQALTQRAMACILQRPGEASRAGTA